MEPAKLVPKFSAVGSLRVKVRWWPWRLPYFCNGWVTILMLVMPACLTASITEAKAPKGTRSSARR